MNWFLIIVLCLMACFLFLPVVRARRQKKRRAEWLASPMPPSWMVILDRNIPVNRNFDDALREQWHGLVRVFLAEKSFVGCAGQEITDEVAVTIAGQACLLILNRDTPVYPWLKTILVYPAAYHDPVSGSNRLGESWTRGKVVLSWYHTVKGGTIPNDAHNVAIHEFAHQLDQEDGAADGQPANYLGGDSAEERAGIFAAWATICNREYEQLHRRLNKGKRTLIDPYGATNPAEFFAVATETFFEKPHQMARHHLELFEQLQRIYHVDPREWY